MNNDVEWTKRFAIMCCLLWKRRCRLLLESDVDVMDDVLLHGNRLVLECSRGVTVVGGPVRGEIWVADSLAKRGHALSMEPAIYYLPPDGIDSLVVEEQWEASETADLHLRNIPMISATPIGIG
ncbi:hypothetical protein V6N13_098302 [Hibiscus sabdariffa]